MGVFCVFLRFGAGAGGDLATLGVGACGDEVEAGEGFEESDWLGALWVVTDSVTDGGSGKGACCWTDDDCVLT